jgi:hypothetical protein
MQVILQTRPEKRIKGDYHSSSPRRFSITAVYKDFNKKKSVKYMSQFCELQNNVMIPESFPREKIIKTIKESNNAQLRINL